MAPSPSGEQSLEEWLAGIGLAEHAASIAEQGYSSLRFVRAASREDIEELSSDLQLSAEHAERLAQAWSELLPGAAAERPAAATGECADVAVGDAALGSAADAAAAAQAARLAKLSAAADAKAAALLELPALPADGEFEMVKERVLLAPVVARLLELLAPDEPAFGAEMATLGAAVAVGLLRHRAATDGAKPCSAEALAAHATALKQTLVETRCDELISRICALKIPLLYGRDNDQRAVAALTEVFSAVMKVWDDAVPGKRHPPETSSWALVPGFGGKAPPSDDATWEWLVGTAQQRLAEIFRDEKEHPQIRAGASLVAAYSGFFAPDSAVIKCVREQATLALHAVETVHPRPKDGPDLLALASEDTDALLSAIFQAFVGGGSSCNWGSRPKSLAREFSLSCIEVGVAELCFRMLSSFRTLPGGPAAASPEVAAAATALVLLVQPDADCSRRVLQSLDDSGLSSARVHETICYAIDHGADVVGNSLAGHRLELKAASLMAFLFGRQEAGDGAQASVTIPPAVIRSCVELCMLMLDGKNDGSIVAQCTALFEMSISDANTTVMVDAGVLDAFALAFSQGADVLGQRESLYGYDIPKAREACARVLLNLALSEKTVAAVAGHAALRSAIEAAAADGENLTQATTKMLKDVQFQLSLAGDAELAAERVKAAQAATAADERHLMLSYCWAQQEIVLQIREELGLRGYKVWLDVEQMAGSTVDAMAEAIDLSFAVCFGISRDYVRP